MSEKLRELLHPWESILMEFQPTMGVPIANLEYGNDPEDAKLVKTKWWAIRAKMDAYVDDIGKLREELELKRKKKPVAIIDDDEISENDIMGEDADDMF